MHRPFVPPYLLERLAEAGSGRFAAAAAHAGQTLVRDATLRDGGRQHEPERAEAVLPVQRTLERTIADARSTERLPGRVVRREGQQPTGDIAADEAYDGFGATHALFADVYGWSSVDGKGLPLDGTVHYGHKYDNAFWNGTRMVFGDGDGEVFNRFTSSLTVIGHELSHGFTQYAAALDYVGQSGALNESISDVFGALTEQYHHTQTADDASWLIGAELFTAAVQGQALRSMRDPGSAYDDDVLGRDPQPDHMSRYVETVADNDGVHINSGIPNRAFALVAIELGGYAWERAGRIWFDTVTGGKLSAQADFADFAEETRATAVELYGAASPESDAVANAWRGVGVAAAVSVRV